jgi:hypothetical protein
LHSATKVRWVARRQTACAGHDWTFGVSVKVSDFPLDVDHVTTMSHKEHRGRDSLDMTAPFGLHYLRRTVSATNSNYGDITKATASNNYNGRDPNLHVHRIFLTLQWSHAWRARFRLFEFAVRCGADVFGMSSMFGTEYLRRRASHQKPAGILQYAVRQSRQRRKRVTRNRVS